MGTTSLSLMLFILYKASNITAEDSPTADSSIKTTADNKVYASLPEIPTDNSRAIVSGTYAIYTTTFVHLHTPASPYTDDRIAAVAATGWLNQWHNNVTTYNITLCKADQQVHFTVSAGENTTGHVLYQESRECQFKVTVPFGNVVHLRVFQCVYVDFEVVDMVDTNSVSVFKRRCMWDDQFSSHLFSLTHTMTVKVVPRYLVGHQALSVPFMSLYFSAANESDRPSLEIMAMSQSSGYVQTQQWDGQRKYPPMTSCVVVTIPTHHVIFLSFQRKRRERWMMGQPHDYQERVVLSPAPCWTTHDSAQSMVFYLSESYEPFIFPNRDTAHHQNHLESQRPTRTHTLSVSYFSNSQQHSGFRNWYSFHPNSSIPQRVEDRWNCSVARWPDLSQHFPCDLVPQCVDAEDEAGCSYTTPLCGAGKVSVEGKCYIYKQPDEQSWLQAKLKCHKSGAFLASLESYQEWRGVLELLSHTVSEWTWIGLEQTQTTPDTPLSYMYTDTWRWLSGTVAHCLDLRGYALGAPYCAALRNYPDKSGRVDSLSYSASPTSCSYSDREVSVLCELPPPPSADTGHVTQPITLPLPLVTPSPVPLVTCPGQHVTHEALACDLHSRCWGSVETRAQQYKFVCQTPIVMALSPPYFQCQTSAEFVAYGLLCNFGEDCSDGSDETFCVHPACETHRYPCGMGQCVDTNSHCDGQWDCSTGQDENCISTGDLIAINTPPPPAVIHFHRLEGFRVTALPTNNATCPDTHFQCPGDRYCLPVYLRCNGFNDCPGHADEMDCNSYAYRCPGFYRCRERDEAVVICLFITHLCDGTVHCPLHDDELWCDLTCPDPCTCHGLAFTCSHPFPVAAYPPLRYLEAAGSGIRLTDVLQNYMLVHLGVRACGWSNLTEILLPNLFSLDLSENFLKHVNFMHFRKTRHLQKLVLAFNPMTRIFSETSGQLQLLSVKVFNLSTIPLESVSLVNLSIMVPNLKVLDLSHSGLKALHGRLSLLSLEVLELRGCPIRDFSHDFMRDSALLRQVSADHFKLCCPAVLPSHFHGACTAPSDAISSCDALLKSDIYRAALAVFSMLSLVGNVGSLVYRFFLSSEGTKVSFSIFVTHLCVSDCLMGLYLALIGVADRVYLGSYLWKDNAWKSSMTCSVAGFLSLLSSEVSALLICLITLDRLLVFRFPFSQLRFRTRSTSVVCVMVWGLGLVIAAVPLLPVTAHWNYYRQTGICIPLPLTRADFAGQGYSFGVMIVINLVLFLIIAVGQALIFWSIRVNSISSERSDTPGQAVATGGPTDSKDMVIARRLLSIAMTDFLCWFPIGLCGVLTAMDVEIPSEVNVAMAIFVLPLNSALNPFIYTLNLIHEKRRKAREARLKTFVMSLLKTNHV